MYENGHPNNNDFSKKKGKDTFNEIFCRFDNKGAISKYIIFCSILIILDIYKRVYV